MGVGRYEDCEREAREGPHSQGPSWARESEAKVAVKCTLPQRRVSGPHPPERSRLALGSVLERSQTINRLVAAQE